MNHSLHPTLTRSFMLRSALLLLMGPLVVQPLSAQHQPTPPSLEEVEALVVRSDWSALHALLQPIRKAECGMEVPFRFLYGHAAMNVEAGNTEAVQQFHCVADSTGSASLNAWLSWTRGLVERYPQKAAPGFLYGDALARSGNMLEAKQVLDLVLKHDAQYVPALNARGVVRWLLFRQDTTHFEYELGALSDFQAAASLGSADAFANEGLITLLDGASLDTASDLFEQALALDSTFWLARNGKAVTHGAKGEVGDFNEEIQRIQTIAPDTPFLALNTGQTTLSPEATRGQTQTQDQFSIGATAKFGGGFFGGPSASISTNYTQTTITGPRGGIYLYLKEGENLEVNDGTRQAGSWFALNYPLVEPRSPVQTDNQ